MLYVRLPGISKKYIDKEIIPASLPTFKFAFRIPVINVLEENLGEEVMLKLVGVKGGIETELGNRSIQWKRCLDIENTWQINSDFPFEAAEPSEASPCTFNTQIKFITSGNSEFRGNVTDDWYNKPS